MQNSFPKPSERTLDMKAVPKSRQQHCALSFITFHFKWAISPNILCYVFLCLLECQVKLSNMLT